LHRGTPGHMRLPHRLQSQKLKSQGGLGLGQNTYKNIFYYEKEFFAANPNPNPNPNPNRHGFLVFSCHGVGLPNLKLNLNGRQPLCLWFP